VAIKESEKAGSSFFWGGGGGGGLCLIKALTFFSFF
jgi:hypothetical protein